LSQPCDNVGISLWVPVRVARPYITESWESLYLHVA